MDFINTYNAARMIETVENIGVADDFSFKKEVQLK